MPVPISPISASTTAPAQVPYQLTSQSASTSAQEGEARILNLAQHGDHTEFDLDISPATEYNRIRLGIDRKDFLVTATVEGRDALATGSETPWPSPSTLFDFSQEKLGFQLHNFHCRTGLSDSFTSACRPAFSPKEVKQAMVAYTQEKKALLDRRGCLSFAGRVETYYGL